VIPVRTTFGGPEAAPDLTPGIEAPSYTSAYARPGSTA
jgi:hypothetical protein